jgi:rubredoxin
MGHYCRICGRVRPNEKFSGKGHKNHICKQCASKPKEKIKAIEQKEEIFGYLKQSRTSEKNIEVIKLAELNFKCKKCKIIFDCDVGKISFPPEMNRPKFEKNIECPNCGILSMDEVILTELGQSQLTEIHLSSME